MDTPINGKFKQVDRRRLWIQSGILPLPPGRLVRCHLGVSVGLGSSDTAGRQARQGKATLRSLPFFFLLFSSSSILPVALERMDTYIG